MRPAFLLVFLMSFGTFACSHERQDAAAQTGAVKLLIFLIDGSQVNGGTTLQQMKVSASYAEFTVDLSQLIGIQFAGKDKSAVFEFRNGDKIHGTPGMSEIELETVVGMVKIPLSKVNRIAVVSGSALPGSVLFYRFRQIAEGRILDESGSGNDGAIVGRHPSIPTSSSQGFTFENSYIECARCSGLKFNRGFSIIAKFTPLSWGQGDGPCLISKKQNDASPGFVLYDDGYFPDKLNLRVRGSTAASDFCLSKSVVEVGVEQEWAVVYDPEGGQVHIYKNGIPDTTYSGLSLGPIANSLPVWIGHSQTWNTNFHGNIRRMIVIDRPLSDADVISLAGGD